MTSTTRRISVTSEQLQSDSLRAQLFAACCAYGIVEWLQYEEDPNYNTTTVRIQFQKLSSADRLRSDMQRRGQLWQIESEAASPCVGSDVLLSSSDALTCARLKAMIPSLPCAKLPGTGIDAAATGVSSSSTSASSSTMLTFEEKCFLMHGRGSTARAALSKVTAEQEAALWSGFEQQSAALRHSCLGPFCAVLHLGTPHNANEFLLQHQLALAEQHSTFAIHVGSAPASPLAVALPKMLARHALTDCPIDGRLVRGYVVAMPSNTYCVVDAGLYPSVEQAATATLVNTHTNFLSVSLGDEVQVQLSSTGGLTIAGEGMVGGKLVRVLSAAAFATRRGAAKAQLPSTAARTLRTSNLTRTGGRGGAAASSSSHLQSPPQQPRPPGISDLTNPLRRNASNPKGLVSGSGGASGVRPMSGAAAKLLASKLFKNIQQKKLSGMEGDGVSAERLCTYPAGLTVYTRLLVRVERIEDDGLHARCVADAENCGYTGPVFIPAGLVPSDNGTTASSSSDNGSLTAAAQASSGQRWKSYAVVGERMHVALLYMVAVGGSAVTMRGVASKKDADLRRAAVASASSAEEIGFSMEEDEPTAVMAGAAVTAVAMLQVGEGDVGVPASSGYATFPAYLLKAGSRASAALRQTPLLLPEVDLGPLDPTALTTSPATLTISEVVNDVARGQYAIVVPQSVYAARLADRAAAQEQRKKAEVDEVKRRLAAVMGDDILDVLNDGDDDGELAVKRPRTGN